MSDSGQLSDRDKARRLTEETMGGWLRNLPSLESLREEIGEFSPEEQAFVDYIKNRSPEEELEALAEFDRQHPGFTERLMQRFDRQ